MYTVEFVDDATEIRTLDQAGEHEDVEVIMDAESVFVRQWNEDMGYFDLIEMSDQQLKDIIAALGSTAGAYYAR